MKAPETLRLHNKLCKRLSRLRRSGIVRYLIYPIIIGLPAYILVTIVVKDKLLTQTQGWIGERTAEIINDSALQILVAVYVLSVLAKATAKLLDYCSKPDREFNREDVLAILNSIEPVVEDKSRRFQKHARDLVEGKPQDTANIFSHITQPKQQIPLLIAALKSALENIDKTNASFRIGIVIVKNNVPESWGFYVPIGQQPSLTPEQLRDQRTTIMHAIKERTMIIIDDVVSETRKPEPKYLKNGSNRMAEGSQLCYPIIHPATQEIEYVLTIAGDQKGCLAQKHAPLYSWILRYYVSRIQLEHSLIIIKSFSEEGNDDHCKKA